MAKVRRYLRYLGFVLFAVLIFSIDIENALTIFARMDLYWLFLAGIGHAAFTFFKSVRWHSLLSIQGIRYPFSSAIVAYHRGSFFSLITPGRIGDVIKVDYLKRDIGVPYRLGISSVIMDRLLDLATLIGSAGLSVLIIGASGNLLQSVVILSVLFALATYVAASEVIVPQLLGASTRLPLVGRLFASRREMLLEAHDAFRALLVPRLVGPLMISLVSYLAVYGGSFAIARAQNLELDLIQIVYAISLTSIVSLIPVTVSGIGTRDLVMILIFSTFGHNKEQAIAFSFAYLVVNILFGNAVGAYYWFKSDVPRQD